MPKYNRGYIKQDLHDSLLLTIVPSGVICMWSGTLATIPTGWHLCDGTEGTPDLTAKFVQGVATAATNPGGSGGATSKATNGHTHFVDTNDASYKMFAAGSDRSALRMTDVTVGPGYMTDSITDIRPPYYEIAFIMKL